MAAQKQWGVNHKSISHYLQWTTTTYHKIFTNNRTNFEEAKLSWQTYSLNCVNDRLKINIF
jgi:hypothetical protein